jgi:hypothetical protein
MPLLSLFCYSYANYYCLRDSNFHLYCDCVYFELDSYLLKNLQWLSMIVSDMCSVLKQANGSHLRCFCLNFGMYFDWLYVFAWVIYIFSNF